MKKLLLVCMLLASTSAMAASTPATTAKTAAPVAATAQANPQKFEERKSEILKRISDHMSELQQRQSCVQSAGTPEALKACKPQGGMHGGKKCGGGKGGLE